MAQRIPYVQNRRRVKLFAGTAIDILEADVNAFLASLPEAVSCAANVQFCTAISDAEQVYLFSVLVDYEEGA